jgi:hypothetical protein
MYRMRRCDRVGDDATVRRGQGRCDGGQGRWWGHHCRRRGRRRGLGQGWWWWRHGVEGGGGGIEGGSAEVGQPDGAKPNFTVIRVLRWRRYSPYTWYIIGIGWCNSADTKNFIHGIGWRNTTDTNNLLYRLAYVSRYQQSLAYKYRPHTTVPTEHTVVAATVPTERTVPTEIIPLFWGIFSTFSNMCLSLSCHGIYRSWF